MPRLENGTGYKTAGPSSDAAVAQDSRSFIIRSLVLECLEGARHPLTADEIADLIEIDFISVRPRVSELRHEGKIRDSGYRRPSRYGRMVTGWELTPKPSLIGEDP
ncbi:hypothetical protein [Tabrizicola sp. BL-A-41-H6]|uniref:hypothetical protein n=1 Tax=Tabrizicola sp. BL-A-41-H6 TaxID=3421107 RepID=UPI003D664F5E